ncbi:hypothetical protein [Vreelandella nanhaiensis]|uniref:Dentin sialophosphoprotein n=1 Tax=Vreelandella nanhaiensis TaxID=1258546 RepID=A0A433KVW8_9GAMM|nr:hypothetical protein [Halomonas nanhaiensis]RUR33641.1 hypothetical protein ELY38_04245 [Halomonas nanhaiensis]
MKRTILALAIGAICTGVSSGVLANNDTSGANKDAQMTQHQDATTAGQQQSTDTPSSQGQSDAERRTGTEGPQQDLDGDDLDMQDQENVDNLDIREEQSGSSMGTQDQQGAGSTGSGSTGGTTSQ